MDFTIKGQKSARSDERSLCRTCTNAHIVEGSRPSQILVRCTSNWNQPIDMTTWHVVNCNEFIDDNTPRLENLEKIAWRVKADPKKAKLGFQSPAEWREEEKSSGSDW